MCPVTASEWWLAVLALHSRARVEEEGLTLAVVATAHWKGNSNGNVNSFNTAGSNLLHMLGAC